MSWPWIALFGVQWIALAVLLIVVLGLNQRVQALWTGARATAAPVPNIPSTLPLSGQPLPGDSPLNTLGSGDRIFLFVGSGCPPCRELATHLAADPSETLRALKNASLFMIADPEGERLFAIDRVNTVIIDDGAIGSAVGVQSTPSAIAVDSAGVVRGATFANTLSDVGRLADRLATRVGAS